jgi:hypothetical protein
MRSARFGRENDPPVLRPRTPRTQMGGTFRASRRHATGAVSLPSPHGPPPHGAVRRGGPEKVLGRPAYSAPTERGGIAAYPAVSRPPREWLTVLRTRQKKQFILPRAPTPSAAALVAVAALYGASMHGNLSDDRDAVQELWGPSAWGVLAARREGDPCYPGRCRTALQRRRDCCPQGETATAPGLRPAPCQRQYTTSPKGKLEPPNLAPRPRGYC